MAATNTQKKSAARPGDDRKKSTNGRASANGSNPQKTARNAVPNRGAPKRTLQSRRQRYTQNLPEVPTWLATVMSVVGVGVAVGAGLYATRRQWLPSAEGWRDDFNAAFADDETDYENFDQTRHAGKGSMRDDPGADWEDIDDMSDASFPASDPPSFNPGTA